MRAASAEFKSRREPSSLARRAVHRAAHPLAAGL